VQVIYFRDEFREVQGANHAHQNAWKQSAAFVDCALSAANPLNEGAVASFAMWRPLPSFFLVQAGAVWPGRSVRLDVVMLGHDKCAVVLCEGAGAPGDLKQFFLCNVASTHPAEDSIVLFGGHAFLLKNP
jgi:hypothetical protein